MVRVFSVYRVDRTTGLTEAVGCILERRDKDRHRPLRSQLAVEARSVFGLDDDECIRIVPEHPVDTERTEETTLSFGRITIISR